jgi:hypothetical protein
MNRLLGTSLVASVVALATSGSARADRRAYGETYEAVTAAEGQFDVEAWHTYANGSEVDNGPPVKGNRTMLELEYGVTSRWDVALYNMIDTGTEDPGYAGLKVETRYRLVPAGTWFVDPVLYLEYQHLFRGDASDKFEVKGIFGRDLGRWNLALNLAFEVEREKVEKEYKPEGEFAFGVSRELGSPAFKLGAEVFGKVEKEEKPGEEELEAYVFAGPAVSWATGIKSPLHGIWLTLAAGRGVTEASEAYYARAIMGLQF